MRPEVRAAVVGTGRIAEEHLRFLASHPSVVLDSVCDTSPTLAGFAGQRFGALAALTSLEAVLARRPDVLHICTPAHTHEEIIRRALDSNVNVICEKPVALSLSEFEKLAAVATAKRLFVTEDHNYRFNPPFVALAASVRRGEIGVVRDISVEMTLPLAGGRYRDNALPSASHDLPGGVLHEFISHMAYLALAVDPQEDVCSAAESRWLALGDSLSYNDLVATVTRGEQMIRLRFVDGWPGQIRITASGVQGRIQCELLRPMVVSETMTARGPLLSPVEGLIRNGARSAIAGVGVLRDKVLNRTAYSGLSIFLDTTYQAFRSQHSLPVSEFDIKKTLHLIELVLEGRA